MSVYETARSLGLRPDSLGIPYLSTFCCFAVYEAGSKHQPAAPSWCLSMERGLDRGSYPSLSIFTFILLVTVVAITPLFL